MSVALDQNPDSNVSTTSGTTLSFTGLTVGSGANRVILASFNYTPVVSAISIAWDPSGANLALTRIVTQADSSGTFTAELWGAVAPGSGNKTLTATWTTAAEASLSAISFTGANQTGGATTFPHSTSAIGSIPGVSGTASLSVTTATTDAAIANLSINNGSTNAASLNQTVYYVDTSGQFAGNFEVGGSSPASFTATVGTFCGGGTWVYVGCDIAAAAGAAATTQGKWPSTLLLPPRRGMVGWRGLVRPNAFPPAGSTISLFGQVTTAAKGSAGITGVAALAGQATTEAKAIGAVAGALALKAQATTQAKAQASGAFAASLAGRVATQAKSSVNISGTVPLAGRASTQAKAFGSIVFGAFLIGRVTTQAKAFAAATGAAQLAGRVATQAKAAAKATGAVPLAGAVTTQAKAVGAAIPEVFLSGRVTTAAQALGAVFGSAALSARATTITQCRAAAAGAVGLAGQVTTAAQAAATVSFTSLTVSLSGMCTTMAKAAGNQAGAVLLAGYLTAQTKVQASSPVQPPSAQFQLLTTLGGVFNPNAPTIG